ncbi:GNAT family N-acetyltransferase [Streptococcus moroccensis]|uniref:Acetyltransferase n=1 Tax=Streptococcus moroccensis TaxID=1451356 RepID=A0ABT9YPZ7_9STRE|nr:GNAT family N-acetyltransferase [Streptococcus moroccensis]MDQ0222056.1 putative acetyltransferase [Streptococcus moroccensis]
MELRQPRLEDKSAFLGMLLKFQADGTRISGASTIWGAAENNYDQFIALLNSQESEDAIQCGMGPFKVFFSWEKQELIGILALRTTETEAVLTEHGHIGYSIRPAKRRQGLAKKQLYLGLLKAKEEGFERVLMTCLKENEASRRTIIANGGQYEKTQGPYEFYWIDLATI